MRADLECLFVGGDGTSGGVLFLRGATTTLVERLQPQRFGGVGHGLGEPVPSFSRTFSMVGRWPVRSR